MGSKIWCQVGEFEFHFQNSYGEMCFWKIMLKVRSFKSTGDHRPFLSKFDVKLGSWGMIHTGDQTFLNLWGDSSAAARTSATVICEACEARLVAAQPPERCGRSFDQEPIFLPSGSSESPTHTERRRREFRDIRFSKQVNRCLNLLFRDDSFWDSHTG